MWVFSCASIYRQHVVPQHFRLLVVIVLPLLFIPLLVVVHAQDDRHARELTKAKTSKYIPVYEKISTVSASTAKTVRYDCIIRNLWTNSRHPPDFPPEFPHWSKAVFASHSSQYTMFTTGKRSSRGVEKIAEEGETLALRNEIKKAKSSTGSVLDFEVAKFFRASIKSQTKMMGLKVDAKHSYISMTVMVAPSPDWFTGIANFNMIRNNKYIQTIIMDLPPYDAGTDLGQTYSARNQDQKGGKIFELTTETIPNSSQVFLSREGSTVLPVARLQCQLRGTSAPKCSSDVKEKCSSNKQCCHGYACLANKRNQNKLCLPCLEKTQKCNTSSECCRKMKCNQKDSVCV